MTILVTGGSGFIGSNFILNWFTHSSDTLIINLDKDECTQLNHLSNYQFIKGDITDSALVEKIFNTYNLTSVINFAAETHVDKSIHYPFDFINSNINGTFNLLEHSKKYYQNNKNFRFVHISTDEVFGALSNDDPAFTETTRYQPNSPYSASKAASDHLVRSYYHTYQLPVITTNCSNNYGPFQSPEKLIPLVINNALSNKPLPIYGSGKQVRDWLYVTDHCNAIERVLSNGISGETYNIGGNNEKTNIEVVETICRILNELVPTNISYSSLITYVNDRPGHDFRYAIDSTKLKTQLNWTPAESFETGIRKTVEWYINNTEWLKNSSIKLNDWYKTQYK